MPTYDYQCRSCGVITEVVHSMLEDGPTKCERCGGELRRLFHPTGIIFKGGGFYKTDSRASSSAAVGTGNSSAAPATGEGGSTATSSKDAAPSDSGKTDKPAKDAAKTGSGGSD